MAAWGDKTRARRGGVSAEGCLLELALADDAVVEGALGQSGALLVLRQVPNPELLEEGAHVGLTPLMLRPRTYRRSTWEPPTIASSPLSPKTIQALLPPS